MPLHKKIQLKKLTPLRKLRPVARRSDWRSFRLSLLSGRRSHSLQRTSMRSGTAGVDPEIDASKVRFRITVSRSTGRHGQNGVPDEEIMGHTRHRSLTTMRSYVRRAKLSQANPAGKLGP